MLALTQCWFTRKHLPRQSGRRNRDGVFRSECRYCERAIVSWDRAAWHLAEGFNLLQVTQGIEGAFLFLVDTRDDVVVARFPIDHLDGEAEVNAYIQQIRADHQMDDPDNTLELRDTRKGKRRQRPAAASPRAGAGARVGGAPLAAPEAATADADRLTGLPGRASFEVAFPLACVQAQLKHEHLSLAFVDIDALDPINRAHGLDAGDAVVCHVAAQLAGLAQSRCYLSRNRGLEFILVFPGAGAALVRSRIEHLRDGIVAAVIDAAPGAQISISSGIAEVSVAGDPRLALRAADLALQRAKANGRNSVVVG